MGMSKIWSLALGVALASCAVSEVPHDPVVEQARALSDDVTPLDDDATTNAACVQTVRQLCTTPILCENGDGVPNDKTCPSGRICCVFHPNGG